MEYGDQMSHVGWHRGSGDHFRQTRVHMSRPRGARAKPEALRLADPLKANADKFAAGTPRRILHSYVESAVERMRGYDAGQRVGVATDMLEIVRGFKQAVGEEGAGSGAVAEAVQAIRDLVVELPLEWRQRIMAVLDEIGRGVRKPPALREESNPGPPPSTGIMSASQRMRAGRVSNARRAQAEREWKQLRALGMSVARDSYVTDRVRELGG